MCLLVFALHRSYDAAVELQQTSFAGAVDHDHGLDHLPIMAI